jgi:hypothetical protein
MIQAMNQAKQPLEKSAYDMSYRIAFHNTTFTPSREIRDFDPPLTKPDIAWLLALNGIQAKVRFCLGMPSLAIRLVSFVQQGAREG